MAIAESLQLNIIHLTNLAKRLQVNQSWRLERWDDPKAAMELAFSDILPQFKPTNISSKKTQLQAVNAR